MSTLVNQPDCNGMNTAEGRYRALLNASTILPSQPDLHSVLRSVSALLTSIVSIEALALLLLDDTGEAARVLALETALGGPEEDLDRFYPLANTAFAEGVKSQRLVFVLKMREELAKVRQLPELGNVSQDSSCYVFPLSSPRKKLG